LWTTTIVVCTIVGLSIYAQVTTMAKQAAAPPSPPESMVLSASEAATTSTSVAPGAASASNVGATGGATNANGAKIFTANCASCHGAQGQGMPGAFPPLANNPVVTGDPNKVVGIVTGGLHGQISVSGMSYNGQMPAWKGQLSNNDIADVITYIRGSLGSNHSSPVTQAQVAGYKP
jgi:mono/diheme cytochrome c family protein